MLHEEAPHPARKWRHVAQLQKDCDERPREPLEMRSLFPRVRVLRPAKPRPRRRQGGPGRASAALFDRARTLSKLSLTFCALGLEAQAAEVLLPQLGSPSPDAEAFQDLAETGRRVAELLEKTSKRIRLQEEEDQERPGLFEAPAAATVTKELPLLERPPPIWPSNKRASRVSSRPLGSAPLLGKGGSL